MRSVRSVRLAPRFTSVFVRHDTVDAGSAILARQLVGFLHPFQVDHVVQRGQHFSRLASRQFGYPSSFRGQVCGAHVPSHVSRRWLSPRGTSLPSFGSWRAQFPALVGTMKALRLPIRVSMVAYWFASTAHGYLRVRVSPQRSRKLGGLLPGQGSCSTGAPIPGLPYVDANGISQVFRRSVLCLCSVPGPRSNRCALATCGHIGAAPAALTAKASAMADFGANTQLRHLLPYASRVALPHTCKARFRLVGWPLPGGRRTLWTTARGFSSCRSSSSPALLTQQRSALPAERRARAPRLSFFLLPKRGAERREGANVALAKRDRRACEARRAPCEVRTPLGAPPWRFLAGVRASVSGISSGIRRASSSQPGH